MREFAIGDIHGCVRSLETLLAAIRPKRDDTIVFLGDYIDRGPDSCAVLELIQDLSQKCTVIALAGNHEKMLLRAPEEPMAMRSWLFYGGRETLESYERHGFGGGIDGLPKSHRHFLEEQTLDYWETDRHIFVHASLDPKLPMKDQPEFHLFWDQFSNPTVHQSGKQIICGHTSQKSGFPAVFDNGICIDTWAYGGGWLTCYETTQRTFLQTNERGERRTFDLGSLIES